jgi:hypothetical protein
MDAKAMQRGATLEKAKIDDAAKAQIIEIRAALSRVDALLAGDDGLRKPDAHKRPD